jgi:predicted O-linked N-acetylglucosamine transferase (SPINDLY family)
MTPAALRSQAEALRHAGRAAEAVDVLLQALGLAPTDTDTYLQLGFALQALGLNSQACEALRTPALLNPASVMAQGYLIHATQKAADWSQFDADLAALRHALAAKPGTADDEFGMPFALVGLPHTRAELLKAAALASRHVARGIRPLPPRERLATATQAPTRLRVGYLSADFHAHATAALLVDLLESHDRERFEIRLYSHGPDDSSVLGQRVRTAAEHVIDVGPLTVEAIAQCIRADGVDLLVDLKGHTAGSRMAALAWRPAPVQVSWLGFPGTSGADFIDYVIGDPLITPMADAADYSECIAQLPRCYQPQDRRRQPGPAPLRAQLGLAEHALVLLGANAVYKITPALWAAWMDVLRRLPDAQLWQLSGGEQADERLREAALQAGVTADRLVFAPPVGMEAHLARIGAADLALDSWPCNGHTTTSDALAAGVPVVTMATDTFPGRVAASLLTAAGMPHCITHDVPGYVDRICALGRDAAARQALRDALGARPAGLYNTARFARELEALYQRMWDRALAGQPPAPLAA